VLSTVETCRLYAFRFLTCFYCSAEHSALGPFVREWVLGGSCSGVYHFNPLMFGSQLSFRGRPKCRIFFNAELRFAPCRRLFCLLLLVLVVSFTLIWHCSLPLMTAGIPIMSFDCHDTYCQRHQPSAPRGLSFACASCI